MKLGSFVSVPKSKQRIFWWEKLPPRENLNFLRRKNCCEPSLVKKQAMFEIPVCACPPAPTERSLTPKFSPERALIRILVPEPTKKKGKRSYSKTKTTKFELFETQ